MADVNWLKIKNEYITTDIGQRPLAKKHGVPFNTLRDRANREKWHDAKTEYRNNVGTKTEQKLEQRAEQEADRNVLHLETWDALLKKIQDLIRRGVSSDDITKLATALDKLQKGQRLALGLDKGKTPGDEDNKRDDGFIDALRGEVDGVWDEEDGNNPIQV